MPTGAGGGPGTLVGSSGTAGGAAWAPASLANASAPAAPTVPASRTRRLRRPPTPGLAMRSTSLAMGVFLLRQAQLRSPVRPFYAQMDDAQSPAGRRLRRISSLLHYAR